MFVPQEDRHHGPKVDDVLDVTAKILKAEGWVNANPVASGKRGNCLGMAIARAAFGHTEYFKVHAKVLEAAMIQTGRRWRDVPQYNDAPGRTFADVLEVIRIARTL